MMIEEYKCPYCGQDSYAKTSKNKGLFTNWKSVINHTSKCADNDKTYSIDSTYGPIAIEEILNTSVAELRRKYPNISFKNKFKSNPIDKSSRLEYSANEIIELIRLFVNINGKIPEYRDFSFKNGYTSADAVKYHFGSWNKGIEAAGFTPNIQSGYGIRTLGLDGHLYRSQAEAYFADTYLYNKHQYIVEPKYPRPYNRYYDWYISSIDLYIELDGGIRPEVTKEKIVINKLLNRKCLFVPTSSIRTFTW
jgi:hypothetical protein